MNYDENLKNAKFLKEVEKVKKYGLVHVTSLEYKDIEYYGAAEPPVRCGESHLSGLTEPPHFIY